MAVVHVPHTANSGRAPFAAEERRRGRVFYVRRGASTVEASVDDLRQVALAASATPFEDTPVAAAAFTDLDFQVFREYLARRSPSGGYPDGPGETFGATLFRNAGFAAPRTLSGVSGAVGAVGGDGLFRTPGMHGGTDPSNALAPTVAAVLLFGKVPQRGIVRLTRVRPADVAGAPIRRRCGLPCGVHQGR